jgi:polysaccharide export outer membrane protein
MCTGASRLLAALLLCGLASGCSSTQSLAPSGGALAGVQQAGLTTQPGAVAAKPVARAGYVLGPGDKLRIIVFNEKELSREYEVNTAGQVTLPLIGAVQAAGQTPSQVQTAVAGKLRQGYIRDPKVSVEVINYRPFYIIGEVAKAGEYPFKSGMNIMSAVAIAGGYTYRASTSKVFVRRANEGIERAYQASASIQIYPGDIVRVPERYF